VTASGIEEVVNMNVTAKATGTDPSEAVGRVCAIEGLGCVSDLARFGIPLLPRSIPDGWTAFYLPY
jgi:hypothetical protein